MRAIPKTNDKNAVSRNLFTADTSGLVLYIARKGNCGIESGQGAQAYNKLQGIRLNRLVPALHIGRPGDFPPGLLNYQSKEILPYFYRFYQSEKRISNLEAGTNSLHSQELTSSVRSSVT